MIMERVVVLSAWPNKFICYNPSYNYTLKKKKLFPPYWINFLWNKQTEKQTLYEHTLFFPSGTDPAGPLFKDDGPECRLDKTDALYVDAIHVDASPNVGLGIDIPVRMKIEKHLPRENG